MAITVAASGTTGQTVGVELTLTTINTEGTYIFNIDTALMATGDVIEFRVKKPVLAGGTARVVYYVMYASPQPTDDTLKVSVPVVVDGTAGGCLFTIKQLKGTTRALPWSAQRL